MPTLHKFSLHLSTWLIISGAAVALLLIVIPGEVDNRYYARDFQLQEHGWPFVHLRRFVPTKTTLGESEEREHVQRRLDSFRIDGNVLPLMPVPGGRYWTDLKNWTFWKGMLAWEPTGCLLNMLVCSTILSAVGFLVERRRSKRNSFWQISIPELATAIVVVAVVFAMATASFRQIQREAKAREMLVEPQACRIKYVDLAPAWLRKLTDNSRFLQISLTGKERVPLGWRVSEVHFADQGMRWFKSTEESARSLECFPYLKTLDHWQSGSDSLKIVANAPAENIRSMSLFPAYSLTKRDYRFLGRFKNLEVLCLRDIDPNNVGFEFPVLPKLVEICVDENRVTPRVLEWLSQQPELKRVKLWSAFPIDDSRWREVQSALTGIAIEDRLGEVHH